VSVDIVINILKVLPSFDPENIPEQNDEEEEEEEVENQVYCVEWRKKKGDHFEFLSLFNKFKDEVNLISNAVEEEGDNQ
jgi:hypothetical protein